MTESSNGPPRIASAAIGILLVIEKNFRAGRLVSLVAGGWPQAGRKA
jgi:hypothetical protein